MVLVDSHCHIDFKPLRSQTGDVLARAKDNGVDYLLCVAVTLKDLHRVLQLAADHANIFASVGVHPNTDAGKEQPTADELLALADNSDVVAIGETGLDYFRSSGDLSWQRERFERHIETANRIGKPLIIHTRDAADDTMEMLEQPGVADAGGVMHCFAEDWEVARRALDIGFHISFSGILTFNNASAIQEVARKAPLDRILVETDAPYLAPAPKRGQTNEPAYVRHTAEFLAELRGMTLEQVAEATTDNFFRLFDGARRSAA
ncbi:MAG: TatD family hydrolase [Pseudomonadota bacterium]|nr:TatD family hydrolase [Pseudomonadota bacterium]